MSWLGDIFGCPVAGDVQLFVDIISVLASACAFNERGIWMPIWSPSKSALNAEQTKGCSCIAFSCIIIGWKACIPTLCKVGALFKSIKCILSRFYRKLQIKKVLPLI